MAQDLTTQNRRDMARAARDDTRASVTLTPAVDIYERGETTIIVADMPGVDPEDVDVTLERQVLTLRGQVKPHAPEGYRRVSSEYTEGDFFRVFTLSDEIDQQEINAEFKNGVLRLELPRAAKAQPRKIAVNAA